MIFKRLFQRAHQNPDPEKRFQSIAKLDSNNEQDKQILHELAFNDDSAKVSIAALEALDSFTLWLKAYETHFQAKVKQLAKDKVLVLIEDSNAVDETLFVDIAQQQKHNVLLKEMIFSSKRLAHMHELCVKTLLKLCAENEVRRFYSERATDAQKIIIIDQADEKSLRRYRKLNNSDDVSAYLDDKLSALEEAAQRPIKLNNAATLINSRLLAASDLNDYASIQSQKNALVTEFEALKSELSILSDDQSAQITSKFLSIKERVDKRLAQLEPEYMAHVHLSAVTDSISDIQNRANTLFQQIHLLTESETPDQLTSQVELLERAIQDLQLELSDIENPENESPAPAHQNLDDDSRKSMSSQVKVTAAHRSAIKGLKAAFDEHAILLKNIPAAVAKNAQLDQLIAQGNEKLENLKLQAGADAEKAETTETGSALQVEEELEAIVKQFESFERKGLSEARIRAINAITKTFHAHKKQRAESLKRLEKRCFAKLSVCFNMIEQGKFKAAIATFHSAQKLLAELEETSPSLSRRYEEISEKVSELKDWQSYLATPKKPALIASAKKLAEDEHIDLQERAKLVKQYRAEFVSLGRLHTEEDDALNKEFDEVIENAFAPCRAHYAQLDLVREKNLKKGEQILTALEALNSVEDSPTLAKHLSAIALQYRKLGDLDKQARNGLHKQYQAKLKPLQARVNTYYEENAKAKQKLIDKALKLSESEDINSAANTAKALQSEWKTIGFAGSKQDQSLWQAFRSANDGVFERVQQQITEQKQASDAKVKEIRELLASLRSMIDSAEQLSALQDTDDLIEQIKTNIDDLPAAQQRAQFAKLSEYQSSLADKIKGFELKKQRAGVEQVFNLLASGTQTPSFEQLASLPSQYRQAFDADNKEQFSMTVLKDMSRMQITMAADILLTEGSEIADSTAKKDVQLRLMAAKLEGQSMPNADELLQHWIAKGALSDKDSESLAILKTCYFKAK